MNDCIRDMAIRGRFVRDMCEMIRNRTRYPRRPFDLELLKSLETLERDLYDAADFIAETRQALSPPLPILSEAAE